MTRAYLACLPARDGSGDLAPTLRDALARQGCFLHIGIGGLLLFASRDLIVRNIPGGRGWVLGHLFEHCGAPASRSPDLDLSPAGAEMMMKSLWGSYVAIAAESGGVRVLRDPSGGLACYHLELGGAHLFTSIPHLPFDCGLIARRIDWVEVARALAEHAARPRRTAIRGVDELLSGTLLTISAKGAERRSIWTPAPHVARTVDDPPEALRAALGSTLDAWGRSLRRPLIEISGGLDSAIVAAGLSPSSTGASLITFAAAPGDPDETLYARAVADHLGLDLTIVQPLVEQVDLGLSLSANLPRPNARAFTQAADALSLGHGRAIGADAFVSGGGGDDIFCYLRTVLPAIDRLRCEGLRAMMSSAFDIAVMNHSTLWEAVYRIVRRMVRGRPGTPVIDLRFLSSDAGASLCSSNAKQSDMGLPGKADHVRSILTIHNYLEGHARTQFAPILSPLLSQPVMECCLSIPTWHWCAGGRNRAVARRAFQDRLPGTVLERRSKGHFDGFCAALFEANRDLIRAMLLEGQLAREGLLDCPALATALANPFPPADTVTRLLALVDVESWIASWQSRPI